MKMLYLNTMKFVGKNNLKTKPIILLRVKEMKTFQILENN